MYQHCIFCSGRLGTNDVVEAFPVGRMLAFDAARGRLWAVCPSCRRWNLAPIEERWEAIETAEKAFREARLRVHSENVGMAKMRDGTHLVRVGQALPGEFAAWRYGREMSVRRWKHLGWEATGAAKLVWLVAGIAGMPLLLMGAMPVMMVSALRYGRRMDGETVLHRLRGAEVGGADLVLRSYHLNYAKLDLEKDGHSLALQIIDPGRTVSFQLQRKGPPGRRIVLNDRLTRIVLRRILAHVNSPGARAGDLEAALDRIQRVGAEGFIHGVARARSGFTPPGARGATGSGTMGAAEALTLEIALNDEDERRAMNGQLAILEAAWREAEGIAAIADRLPDELPEPNG
jgi:hypothetical protein